MPAKQYRTILSRLLQAQFRCKSLRPIRKAPKCPQIPLPALHPAAALLAPALVILVMILTLTPAGCGSPASDSSSTQPTTSSEADLAMSEVARLAPAAPDSDVRAAAKSVQDFGVDLYQKLATQPDQANLVFSPTSVVTALAMTYAGAAGATAQEMAATLHFALQSDALHQAFNSLDAALESRSWQRENAQGDKEGVLIRTANSLWGQRGIVFEKAFLDTLAADYGAGIRLVDFKTAAEQARQAINQWVATETNDKITDLIAEGALTDATRLVLTNAIYLDATWLSPFDPRATTEGQFTTAAGNTVTTPMMRQTSGYPYVSGEGWQAVELPYAGKQLAMTLIVPDQGQFADVEGRLSQGLLTEVFSSLAQGPEVDLTLPKFKFRTQAGLGTALADLGMPTAFDPEKADFSNMTKQEVLFIDDVVHEAFIAVDEEGTEAAAATAVIAAGASAPTDIVQVVVDRPFIFALRDLETGALLFLGRVTDPTVS